MGVEQSTANLPNDSDGAAASPQPEVKVEDTPLSRPFPPPMNTADVLAQFQHLNSWTTIGEDDGLMIGATSSLKRKAEDAVGIVQEDGIPTTASLVPSTNGINDLQSQQHHHALQPSTAHVKSSRKKKRLTLSKQALELVEATQNDITNSTPKHYSTESTTSMAQLPPRLGMVADRIDTQAATSRLGDSHKTRQLNIFDDSESSDEGYFTGPSFSSAAGPPKDAEDEDQVVRTLAKLLQRSAARAQHACETESDAPSPQEQLAADARSREEAAGAERSRMLRERKSSGDISRTFGGHLVAHGRAFIGGHVQQEPLPRQDTSSTFGGACNEQSDEGPKTLHCASFGTAGPAGSSPKLQVRQLPSLSNSASRTCLDKDFDDTHTYDIEDDFDLVKRHVDKRSSYHAALNGSAPHGPRAHYNAGDPNPASRAAAKQWRTQDRHRDHGLSPSGTDIAKGNVDAEARLRALTQHTNSLKESRKPLPLPQYSQVVPQKFYGLEAEPTSKSAFKTPVRQPARIPTSLDSSSNGYDSPNLGQQHWAGSRVVDHHALDDYSDGDSTAISLKTLPVIDIEDDQQIMQEHERLKDQKRDLDVVKGVYWEVASIYALDDLTAREQDELRELRKFVKAVLIDQGPGKFWRKRAQDIRSNMKTRLEKLLRENAAPVKSDVQKCLSILLKESRIAILDQLLKQNEDRGDDLRARRFDLKEQRKNLSKKEKRVRSAERKPRQQKVTKAQREREHAGELQRTLDRMPGTRLDLVAFSKPSTGALGGKDLERSSYAEPQSESEISEETEGEDNYPGAGVRPSEALDFMGRARHQIPAPQELVIEEDDIEEIHRIDDERQQEQAEQGRLENVDSDVDMDRPPVIERQQFDKKLLREMRRKDRDRGITHPFDDLDELSDDSSVPTGIVRQFRYNVMGAFKGSARYSEGVEQPLRFFQNEGQAQTFLRRFITDLADENASTYGNNYDLNTVTRGGRYEQMLVMGDNEEVSARVWIEREVINVDLDRIAATKAMKRKLAMERVVYRVSITTTSESATTAAAATSQAAATQAHAEEDELFGRSRSPTPTPIPPPATSPSPKETRYFSVASLANRSAKDAYMHWYSRFDPSFPSGLRAFPRDKCTIGYSGMLGHMSDALDEELRTLGDVGCWRNSQEVVHQGRRESWKGIVEEVCVEGPSN